jgi:hypothetical protein
VSRVCVSSSAVRSFLRGCRGKRWSLRVRWRITIEGSPYGQPSDQVNYRNGYRRHRGGAPGRARSTWRFPNRWRRSPKATRPGLRLAGGRGGLPRRGVLSGGRGGGEAAADKRSRSVTRRSGRRRSARTICSGSSPADDREESPSRQSGDRVLGAGSRWSQLVAAAFMAGCRAVLGPCGSRLPGRRCEAAGPRRR